MHKCLIQVSNINFYQNQILTGYNKPKDKRFLDLKVPFIFVNVGDYKSQKLIKTSFMNKDEINAILQFIKFWDKYVNSNKHHGT